MKQKKGRTFFFSFRPKGEGNKPLESNIFDEGHNYNETGLAYRQAEKGGPSREEGLAFPGPVCTEQKCLYFEYYTLICLNVLRIFISFLYFRKQCSIELMTCNAFDESYYKNIYIFFCSVHSPFYTLNTHFSPVPFRSIPRRSCCLNTFARLRRGNFRIYNNAWFMLRATNPPSLQLPRNLPFLLHLNAKFVGWRGVGWVGSNVRPFRRVFCSLFFSKAARGVVRDFGHN